MICCESYNKRNIPPSCQVLLVFPDGTGPALLSCLIGGIPLNRVHELQFRPGEVRCRVTYEAVKEMASRSPPSTYYDAIERGRVELKRLRENPDKPRNVKDLKYEVEREIEMTELKQKEEEEEAHRDILKRSVKDDQRMMRLEDGTTENLLYPVSAGVAVVVASALGANEDEAEIIGGRNTTETNVDDKSSQSSTASVIVPEATGSIYAPTDDHYSAATGMSEDMMNEYDDALSSSDITQKDSDYDDAWLDAINEIISDNK